MVGNSNALKNRYAAANPYIIADDDILVILWKLVRLIKRHHGSVENICTMISSNNCEMRAAHDVIADMNLRTGRQKRCSWANIYIMSHVNIFNPLNFTTTTDGHVFTA